MKTKTEEGVIESNNPNTVLTTDDQTRLRQMFKDEFVTETQVIECNKCGFGDSTKKMKKCPNEKCGGDMVKFDMRHNRVTGAWKKEAAK